MPYLCAFQISVLKRYCLLSISLKKLVVWFFFSLNLSLDNQIDFYFWGVVRVWKPIVDSEYKESRMTNIVKNQDYLDSYQMNNTFFSPLVPIPQYIMNDIIRHFKLLNCLFFQIYANYRYQGGSMYKVGWFLPITLQKWEVYALWNDLVKCFKIFHILGIRWSK